MRLEPNRFWVNPPWLRQNGRSSLRGSKDIAREVFFITQQVLSISTKKGLFLFLLGPTHLKKSTACMRHIFRKRDL